MNPFRLNNNCHSLHLCHQMMPHHIQLIQMSQQQQQIEQDFESLQQALQADSDQQWLKQEQLLKWNQSQISQSTNYQTHHSHIYSHSHKAKVWSSRKQPACLSNSPVKHTKYDISSPFLLTHSPYQHEFKALRLHKIESTPEKPQFRSRTIRNSFTSSLGSIQQLQPHVTAASYIAVFSESAAPLMSCNPDEKRQIASLTKIMTAYTVIQICHQFGIKVREHSIPILTRASYMEGTSANLRSGEEILIIDLLYGLLLPSGNDAGTALAQYFGKFLSFKFAVDNNPSQHGASNLEKFSECKKYYDQEYERGSIRLFVFEMNKYAHSLGMHNTKFVNPTGLTNASNYSTARDLALLTSYCLRDPLMRLIFRRKVHKCEVRNDKLGYNREVIWKNTNKLLYKFKECIGVKTGLTPGAGPCLSSAYRVGSRELVVIVLHCQDPEERFQDSEKIYKWCRRQSIPHF